MSTKPDSETEWSKEFPLEREGHWWMRYNDGSVDTFHLNEYNSARPENFLDVAEWLGPISPSDFEQLIRLRKAAFTTIERLDAERKRLCGYCEGEERWGHLWDAVALDHVWNREGDKFNGQRLKCRAKEIQSAIAALREALAPKGEKS